MPQGERTEATALLGDEDGGQSFTGIAVQAILGRLDDLAAGLHKAKPRIPWEGCHPVWQTGQVPLTAGAGTLIQPNLYGPELPYWWDLRTISLWGWTAGTVTCYLNFTTGEQIAQAVTPGQFTWSAQIMLGPQDSVVVGATGITGTVNVIMRAIEVQAQWLPEYLM
jgi:hypothetical protein